ESFSSYGNRKNLTWNAVPTLFNATQGQPRGAHRTGETASKHKNDPDPSGTDPGVKQDRASLHTHRTTDQESSRYRSGVKQDRSQPPHTQRPPEPVSREHSYALSDLRVMKARFFGALESNAKLRKRLKVKVEIIRRTKLKLQAANRELERLRAANRSTAGADPV
ncbi:THAP domain-containing protein 3 isoform X2, partial [Huso huso]